MIISWSRIARAVSYYEQLGFINIDVPWVVSEEAIKTTMPSHLRSVESWMGHHVGSAEQSFIELFLRGIVCDELRLQATTPCFRDEIPTPLNQLYFMKTELFSIHEEDTPLKLAEIALKFLSTEVKEKLHIVKTSADETYDIRFIASDVELGSYGYRRLKDITFCYGTGLAEPRTSYEG
jgi:hypothetical protein